MQYHCSSQRMYFVTGINESKGTKIDANKKWKCTSLRMGFVTKHEPVEPLELR